MANEHLGILPTGLSAEDFTMGDSLLDYTPPSVGWQSPLAPTGENIFSNYVMTSRSRREPTADAPNALFGEPDLLRTYNRRLARYGGTGGLPESPSLPGQPETMSEYGLRHWNEFGSDEGRKLVETQGPFGGAALWSDPGRSPYLGYPGGVRSGGGGAGAMAAAGGRLPQPDVSGYEYAYPVWGWNDPTDVTPGYYSAGGPSLTDRFYTQDIGQYPYFPYSPGAGQQADGSQYISVGQEMLPTSQYPEGRFRYHAGNWWEAPQ
jgi:hypothetical protein